MTQLEGALAAYATSLEEDEKLLKEPAREASASADVCVRMRCCEKRILTGAIAYASVHALGANPASN